MPWWIGTVGIALLPLIYCNANNPSLTGKYKGSK